MIYAIYKDTAGNETGKLYYSHEQYIKDTFSPLCEEVALIDFKISGYGYRKRKASAQAVAVAWSNMGNTADLSWMDCAALSDWFYNVGSLYGLLTEFRENGLC